MHQDFDREAAYEEFYRLCSGKTTRSGFMKRAAQLGLGATAISAFVKAYNPATARADVAAVEAAGPARASAVANLGFYSWILNFNPQNRAAHRRNTTRRIRKTR